MELNLSPNFTVDDIRKVRDYYDKIAETMSMEEFSAHLEKEAEPVFAKIERLRAARKTKEQSDLVDS